MNFSKQHLYNFCKEVFIKIGCPNDQASLAADVLVSADLRGVDSHGIARLKGYVNLWESGRLNPNPKMKVIYETPSTATLDADKSLGLVSAPRAMEIAIEKAKKVGTGWVAVKNSNHFGIAAYHTMIALKHDMVGFGMTNASPLVAPTFSKERLLGTNPISVAIPAKNQPPFVADLATTPTANGKLELLMRKGEMTAEGFVQDREGNPSIDPSELKQGGALLPLGGDRIHGSHKGYCLGAVVDIFSGVLSGANYGPWVPPFVSFADFSEEEVGDGIGHFLGAMRIDAFRPKDEFKDHMDNWIDRFRNSQAIEGKKVLIPGDPEVEKQEYRLNHGIPLEDFIVEDLQKLAEKFELEF